MELKDKTLLSIIIVTYNVESYIEECINKILDNDSNCYELIIIDGKSTDNTVQILQKYKNRISHLISEPDKGIYDAMNKGVKYASGRFLYFIGADDIFLMEIEKLKNILVDTSKIYYGNVIIRDSKIRYDGIFDKTKIIKKNICHQSIFYPIQVFHEYKYETEYKTEADYVLNIRLFGNKNFTFKYINEDIAIYNDTGLSSQHFDSKFSANSFIIIFKSLGIRYLVLKIYNKIIKVVAQWKKKILK